MTNTLKNQTNLVKSLNTWLTNGNLYQDRNCRQYLKNESLIKYGYDKMTWKDKANTIYLTLTMCINKYNLYDKNSDHLN